MEDDKQLYHYYLIPGLGFNAKTFQNLQLPHAASVTPLDWIVPEPGEPLENYIRRMAIGVDTTQANKVLVGHSFGGVVVQEMSQFIPSEKVFLLSSIKSPEEISWNLRILRKLPLFKLVTHELINSTFPLWAKWHDFHTDDERSAFTQMVSEMDIEYFRWAVNAILQWDGIGMENRKTRPVHIHGSNDQTFLHSRIIDPITVSGGGHFMVYNRADEISRIILDELEKDVKKLIKK
jgi:pimeloyl-ACP methyl ester carboxylesterase